MRSFPTLTLGILVVLAGLLSPANAEPRIKNYSTPVFHEELSGTLVAVMLHEVAHAVIDILDALVAGPQEDAADEFAAMLLLAEAERGDTDALVMVEAFATTWLAIWERYLEALERDETKPDGQNNRNLFPLSWYLSEHSFELKRAVNVLCLLYGADPSRATSKLIESKLPADDEWKRRCGLEYIRKRDVWVRILAPTAPDSSQSDIVLPGGLFSGDDQQVHLPPQSPKGRSVFKLEFTPTGVQQQLFFEQGAILSAYYERALGIASRYVDLPFDVPVIAGDCGEPDAYYSPTYKHIILCHEFVRLIAAQLVNYQTDLDFESWFQQQRLREINSDLVGFWRHLDPFAGLSGSGIDLKFYPPGNGELFVYSMVDGKPAPETASFTSAFFWGVTYPPFDPDNRWIWYLDAQFGLFQWSKIEKLSPLEMQIDGFQEGVFKRLE